jgi:hypothetical protein
VVLTPHSSQDLIAASGIWFCLLTTMMTAPMSMSMAMAMVMVRPG